MKLQKKHCWPIRSLCSTMPRLMPWSSSPPAGGSSRHSISTMLDTRYSDCPTPTVSTIKGDFHWFYLAGSHWAVSSSGIRFTFICFRSQWSKRKPYSIPKDDSVIKSVNSTYKKNGQNNLNKRCVEEHTFRTWMKFPA